MKKLKILVVGPTPPPFTGMSVVTEMLLNSSLKDKFKIVHLDTVDRREISNMGKFDLVNFFLALKHFVRFLYLCIRNKPDLIYLPISQNFFGYIRDFLLLAPCLIFKMKIVIHLHGGYFRNFYERSHVLLRKNIHFVLQRISAVIVLGECLRDIFRGLVSEEKIFVVPNGVDDCFTDKLTKPCDNTFKIIFLSNFIREKGIFNTLKVIFPIISQYKNIKFIFAGEWCSKRDKIEADMIIESTNIKENIEFMGRVGGMVKKELLSSADLFILPTFYPLEGQPLVILEAMSAGLPIITTNKGAISETVENEKNGVLIDVSDDKELLESIKRFISNRKLCIEMGTRNRQIYLQRYTKDIFIDNLLTVLTKVGHDAILEKDKSLITKQPKILVVGYLPPPQEGTAKITEVILKSDYIKNNFRIRFLHLFKRISVIHRGRFDLANIIQNAVNILNYLRLILQFRPAIVYAPLAQNRFGFLRDSVLIVLAKILRRRVYSHFHGGNFDLFYHGQGFLLKKYIGFILGNVDQLILLAEKFKTQFTPFVNNKKISYLFNCCPWTSVMSKRYFHRPSDKKTCRVLFIGYISKAKGALDIVKAIPKVIANYREPLEFILCGQPVDIERNIIFIPDPHYGYSNIKKLIEEKSLSHCVKLYPEVVGEDKERMFSDADIFVFPSYSEGCGLVVLEAMIFGLPVITTSVGALGEMLEDGRNCFFVKPGDIDAIAEKILFLLANPDLRREMGRVNKELIKQRYNPEKFLKNLADIWNNMFVS